MSTTTQMKVKPTVFRYDANRGYKFPQQTTFHPELDAGLESFIQERGYRLLPGLSPSIETFVSEEATDRFLVIARYDAALLFVVFANSLRDYTKFMQEHAACFSVWPHLFMPEQVPAPADNYIVNGPLMARSNRY